MQGFGYVEEYEKTPVSPAGFESARETEKFEEEKR